MDELVIDALATGENVEQDSAVFTSSATMILNSRKNIVTPQLSDASCMPVTSNRNKLNRSLSDEGLSYTTSSTSAGVATAPSLSARRRHATNTSNIIGALSGAPCVSREARPNAVLLRRQNTAPATPSSAPRSSSFPELSKPQLAALARQITLNNDTDRQCWICYAQESEEQSQPREFISPCKCSGTTKWVHQKCLMRWIDARQRGNIQAKVKCPQCSTTYRIRFRSLGTVTRMLDAMDLLIARAMPYAAGGVLLASVYWTATSYGAFTIILALGARDGLRFIDEHDSRTLLVALPSIPVFLVLLRTVEWHEIIFGALLSVKRGLFSVVSLPFRTYRTAVARRRRNLTGLNSSDNNLPTVENNDEDDAVEHVCEEDGHLHVLAHKNSSPSRTLCGALLMPIFATLTGRLLYRTVFPESRWHQALAGCVTFLAAKGVVQIFYRRRKLAQFNSRKVVDYSESHAAVAATVVSGEGQALSSSTTSDSHMGGLPSEPTAAFLTPNHGDVAAFSMPNDDDQDDEDGNEDPDDDENEDDGDEEQSDNPAHSSNFNFRLLVHIEL